MLKELKIENLALIEELHVDIDSNLVVFTGETGAGKSIVLQAIALLSGRRASASWIRNGSEQARVEAVFGLPDRPELQAALEDMGVEAGPEILVGRVLSRKGRNRFYVNGGLATANMVERISELLLSVASQHDHQLLLSPRYHLDFIDLAGDLWGKRQVFEEHFLKWGRLREKYEELISREREKEQRRDFLSFQMQEINDANIRPNEDEELESQKKILKASDELRRRGGKSFDLLNGGVVDALAEVRKEVETMAAIDEGLAGIAAMVAEQSFGVEESLRLLQNYIDQVPDDLEALESVTARIDLLQKLKRKYGHSLEDVLAHGNQIAMEIEELESMGQLIAEVKRKYRQSEDELLKLAADLSAKRQSVGKKLSADIKNELGSLCFEQAEFEAFFKEIDTGNLDKLSKLGWDKPEFLFSANPGEPLKPLAKIASGGELSRLTLAMKCILARKDMVETVIFDEVDAGIGGKAAEAVARKIKELAGHHQVLCITHLPQIASCAREHLLVEKEVVDGRTKTQIKPLAKDSRLAELARMLDGDMVSGKSLAFAAELIDRNK